MLDKPYYTMEEVDVILKQHIDEESKRRDWYKAHSKDSKVYKFMEDRNKAFHEYFLYPISPELQLMADGTIPMEKLDKQKQRILDEYLELKRIYEEYQKTYLEIYENLK